MGWGGMLTFMWSCTHTWCYVRDGVGWDVNVHVKLHTYVMLRQGWDGVGWGGMLTFMWSYLSCTHTWCYVRDGVGWDGNVHVKFPHIRDALSSGGSHMLSMKTCFSSVALKWPNFDTCKRASENHPLGATLLMFFIFLVTCSWSTEKVARVLKIRSSKKTSCCNKLHSSRKQTDRMKRRAFYLRKHMQSSFKRSHVFASLKAATKNVTNRRQVGKELSRELQCAKTEVK